MDQIERDVEPQGLSRRTVVTAAAWAAPVVALASAAPTAAASVTPPAANYAVFSGVANPASGSSPSFRFQGAVKDADGDYSTPATIPGGTILTFTFTNGATASGYANLEGVKYLAGSITSGTIQFEVIADTSAQIRVQFTSISPAGGKIEGEILGGTGGSTII